MNPLQNDPSWKPLVLLGAAGALIYFLLLFVPAAGDSDPTGTNVKVIGKAEAESHASSFVNDTFGEEVTLTHAVHQSDRILNGYLSKEKLIETYSTIYDKRFPPDTYQVEVRTQRQNSAGRETVYFVYIHMESGEVVGWNRLGGILSNEAKIQRYDLEVKHAKSIAMQRGFRPEELTAHQEPAKDGSVVLDVIGGKISEAQLQLHIRMVQTENGGIRVMTYKPSFAVPENYTSYVEKQDRIATYMTYLGYAGLSVVFFILSIVYAALYRRYSSFLRGLFLTGVFLVFYITNNFNVSDGIRASFGENPEAESFVSIGLIVTVLLSVLMAASVYFALVGGDALWRHMGSRLWPRFREAGYGEHVWRSMKVSYLLAFLFLGLQQIIYLLLTESIGTWITSDVTQSPYNFEALWLFPLLAWAAAISEEAVYRLFGIGLLRKWFKNLFFASLIPAVIWALGHVMYPIYPVSTRLIELTIMGLIFSYAFIRFGFITSVFTHAIINSVLMSMMLFFHGSAIDIIAGAVYIVLPAAIAWIVRFWHNKKGPKPQAVPPIAPPLMPR